MDGEALPLGLTPLSTQPHPEPAPLAPLTPLSDSTGAGDSSEASRLPTVEGTPIEETEDEAAQAYVNEKQYARVILPRGAVEPLAVPLRVERALGLELCLLYTSPSPRDKRQSRMPSSA